MAILTPFGAKTRPTQNLNNSAVAGFPGPLQEVKPGGYVADSASAEGARSERRTKRKVAS